MEPPLEAHIIVISKSTILLLPRAVLAGGRSFLRTCSVFSVEDSSAHRARHPVLSAQDAHVLTDAPAMPVAGAGESPLTEGERLDERSRRLCFTVDDTHEHGPRAAAYCGLDGRKCLSNRSRDGDGELYSQTALAPGVPRTQEPAALRGDNAARSVARGLARSESIRPATTQLNSTTQAYQAADTSVPAKEIKTKTKRGATFDEWRRSQQHLAAAAEEVDAREDARRSGGTHLATRDVVLLQPFADQRQHEFDVS